MITLLFLAAFGQAIAAEESGVIDLGEFSVTGELRKPSIQFIESQKSVREVLPEIFKAEFEEFENTLLEGSP